MIEKIRRRVKMRKRVLKIKGRKIWRRMTMREGVEKS